MHINVRLSDAEHSCFPDGSAPPGGSQVPHIFGSGECRKIESRAMRRTTSRNREVEEGDPSSALRVIEVMPSSAGVVEVDESWMKLNRVDADEIIFRTNHVRQLSCAYPRQGKALIELPRPNCLEPTVAVAGVCAQMGKALELLNLK